jgi:hypothetical protein
MDVVTTDPVTGRTTGLAKTVRRTLRAMERSGLPYSVIGATALAVRGLPRMTRDLDLVVMVDEAAAAIAALKSARLSATTPVHLLFAAGDPEAMVCEEAPRTLVFGVEAPVATLEQLLLLYLYSNQPKHMGDFAAIVQSGRADIAGAERKLADLHPEMLDEFRRRVREAREPGPAPAKPPRLRRR